MEETKTEERNQKVQEIITSEDSFLNKLADLPTSAQEPNFDLLSAGVKKQIEEKQQVVIDYLTNTDPTTVEEDKKNEVFFEAIKLWDELKDSIKHAECNIVFTNIELKTLHKKMHNNLKYNAETIFYAMHLKKHFLNNLPKLTGGDFSTLPVKITFSQATALYHIISDIELTGLSKETYAFAHVLYHLSEITNVYNYFDRLSASTSKQIQNWNIGLSGINQETTNQETKMEVVKDKDTDTDTNK